MKSIITILYIILLAGCKSNDSSSNLDEATSISTGSGATNVEHAPNHREHYSTSSSGQGREDGEHGDGTYCADVEYSNPNTGTESSYELEVEVEDNEIIQINFPSGYMDQSHFSSGGELDDDEAEIESDMGYTYTIHLTGSSQCRFKTKAIRCMGITKSGTRCRKLTDNPDGYCSLHESTHLLPECRERVADS